MSARAAFLVGCFVGYFVVGRVMVEISGFLPKKG